jgi:2-dehydropantoate 2-reductase
MASPHILIFGTGGVGAIYAYLLSRVTPLTNIVTVCRSNHDVAARDGFMINSTAWGDNLNVKPTIVRTVEEAAGLEAIESFDYILVCAKALSTTPSIAKIIEPAVSDRTTIVLVQNGIAIEEPYSKLYPSNTILSTVIYLPATQISPAVIAHKEVDIIHVGTYPANATVQHKDTAKAFVSLMTSTGTTAHLHEDVQFERWSKLLVNVPWNPICALTRSRDVYFLASSPSSLKYVEDVMMEVARTAQAYGYSDINEDLVKFQINRAKSRSPPGVEPSMMADALAGRRMETEAIVGNTLRLAEEKGIDTPLLRSLYFLVTGLDSSFERP